MGRPTPDLAGQRFGRLVAIRREPNAPKQALWFCECDCGRTAVVSSPALRHGKTKSCGCWRREFPAATKTRHGYATRDETGNYRHAVYRIWRGMRSRCENPNQPHYPRYGGRGIKVCERWRDFANFLADMGERPSPRHSLDRIDSDGDYEPGNVRWATASEQRHNARTGAAGSRHGNAKLTEKDARAIRESKLSGAQLARAFKVSQSVISGIRLGKTWQHAK